MAFRESGLYKSCLIFFAVDNRKQVNIRNRGTRAYLSSIRMSYFLVILFLSFTFSSVSEASHDKKHPSAVVVGTVYCETCFQQEFSTSSYFISGASVAVECKDGNSKPRFRKEVKTNEHGEFKVQLPFSVSKHVKRIKGCTVKLVSSSEPYCAVASATSSSSSLRLKSRRQGEHIFSAGFFSFTPLKQPNLCSQKPSIHNSKELAFPPITDPAFPPPIQDPSTPGGFLPPLPALPPLPPLPRIPGLPYPPVPGRTKDSSTAKSANKPQFSDHKVVQPDTFPLPPNPFPPNPFLPPPNNPNPLQPPNSSPFIPSPNPFQPPQSGPFPTVPGLTPSQPPPVFPFPFPPVFPSPSPVTPPASSSMNASP